jgi:hypothetical protein
VTKHRPGFLLRPDWCLILVTVVGSKLIGRQGWYGNSPGFEYQSEVPRPVTVAVVELALVVVSQFPRKEEAQSEAVMIGGEKRFEYHVANVLRYAAALIENLDVYTPLC